MVVAQDIISPETSIIPNIPAEIHEHETTEKEDTLAQRYNRKNLFQKELTFEFTRDKALLQQYYRIRAQQYILVHSLSDFPEYETEDDRNGYIMVVRIGNFCVGGLRIDASTARKPRLLPMEKDGFKLVEHFPQLSFRQMGYAQASGLVLLPEFRGGDTTKKMISRMYAKCAALNLDMLFCQSPLLNARLYKQDLISLGSTSANIHYDIILPEDPTTEGIKLYLVSSRVEKLQEHKTSIAASSSSPELAPA